MLNITTPNFFTRVKLYLKPKSASVSLMFTLLMADTVLSITYISCQFAYVVDGHYEDDQDKLVQLLIAFGVTGVIMFYCIADASRFLQSWTDRILYFISCLLQKPILLPIILPGHFFRSYIATKEFDGREIATVDGVHTTTFMLAVQEANFLYSFTLSAFSALATFLSSHEQTRASTILFILSGVYSIFGIIVSIYMYGRKTTHDPDSLNRKTFIYKSLESQAARRP